MNKEVICFGLGGSGSFFVSDVRREFELSNFADCVCLLAEIGCGEESHNFFMEVLSKEPKMRQTQQDTNRSDQWKSPLRVLVRSFQKSRDRWKSKYQNVKAEIKRFRNQAQDAKKSRDKWKLRVQDLQHSKQELQQEVTRLTAEMESHRQSKKGARSASFACRL